MGALFGTGAERKHGAEAVRASADGDPVAAMRYGDKNRQD